MTKLLLLVCALTGFVASAAEAGFRSPESLIRNVYGYYGQGAAELSHGLPHDAATARQFFDGALQQAWASAKPPYDFLVQSTSWKLGAIGITTLRKQFDKTYVAVTFSNSSRAVALNFIVVNREDGWLISDIESPHDSLRLFLAQPSITSRAIDWRRPANRPRGRRC